MTRRLDCGRQAEPVARVARVARLGKGVLDAEHLKALSRRHARAASADSANLCAPVALDLSSSSAARASSRPVPELVQDALGKLDGGAMLGLTIDAQLVAKHGRDGPHRVGPGRRVPAPDGGVSGIAVQVERENVPRTRDNGGAQDRPGRDRDSRVPGSCDGHGCRRDAFDLHGVDSWSRVGVVVGPPGGARRGVARRRGSSRSQRLDRRWRALSSGAARGRGLMYSSHQ